MNHLLITILLIDFAALAFLVYLYLKNRKAPPENKHYKNYPDYPSKVQYSKSVHYEPSRAWTHNSGSRHETPVDTHISDVFQQSLDNPNPAWSSGDWGRSDDNYLPDTTNTSNDFGGGDFGGGGAGDSYPSDSGSPDSSTSWSD